ncbi:gp53-like domain-containing protein, partial [Yersinia enterocolitica]
MMAINFPPLCRAGRIFTDFAMCNCFSKNLGLGDAAKKSVGTGVNQIPDMSSFISSFAQNGYFKFPGGLIIQWGEVTGSTTATVPTNFPIPFPNALMSTALAIDL